MSVIGVLHVTDPGGVSEEEQQLGGEGQQALSNSILWAGSSRAISIGPGGLSVNAIIASALVIRPTGAMTVAAVGARGLHHSCHQRQQ